MGKSGHAFAQPVELAIPFDKLLSSQNANPGILAK